MANAQEISFYLRMNNGNGCQLTFPTSTPIRHIISMPSHWSFQLPPVYRLLYKGKHIKDYSQTLHQIGITQNSILHIEAAQVRPKRSEKIDVSVFYEGQKLIIKSSTNDKILTIKQNIYKLININPKSQLLVFKGHKLNNEHTLTHYRIGPDSLICLIYTPKYQQKEQQSFQRTVNAILPKQNELLGSVLSLNEKKVSSSSKSTLFRSDSIDKKKLDQIIPFQIEIQEKRYNHNLKQQSEDLFFSCGDTSNKLKLSLNCNLFDSFRHPIEYHQVYSQEEDDPIEQRKVIAPRMDLACSKILNSEWI